MCGLTCANKTSMIGKGRGSDNFGTLFEGRRLASVRGGGGHLRSWCSIPPKPALRGRYFMLLQWYDDKVATAAISASRYITGAEYLTDK